MKETVKWINNLSPETRYIYFGSLKKNNLMPGPPHQEMLSPVPHPRWFRNKVCILQFICAVLSFYYLKMLYMNSLSGKCAEEGKTFPLNTQNFSKCEAINLWPLCFHMNWYRYPHRWKARAAWCNGRTDAWMTVPQGFCSSLLGTEPGTIPMARAGPDYNKPVMMAPALCQRLV